MMCILKKKGKDSFLNTSLLVVMVSGCNIHGSGVQGDVEAWDGNLDVVNI